MPNYGNAKYWNKRYSKNQGDTFDWLEDFNSLKDAIYENVELVRKASNNLLYMPKILNLGCGNSVVAEAMYDSGLTNIFNIDISPVCIEAMQQRNEQARPLMKFQVMDALQMQFENGSFDIVIDKSTIDAILCGKSSFINVAKMVFEIQRVLTTGGVYMIISYGEPNTRLLHLTRSFLFFQISYFSIEKYVEWLEKTENADSSQLPTQQTKSQILIHYIYNCVKTDQYNQIASQQEFELVEKKMLEEEKKEREMFPQLFIENNTSDDDSEIDQEEFDLSQPQSYEQDLESTLKKAGYPLIEQTKQELVDSLIQQQVLDKNLLLEGNEDQLMQHLIHHLQQNQELNQILEDLGLKPDPKVQQLQSKQMKDIL